jgi:hypothetical protein
MIHCESEIEQWQDERVEEDGFRFALPILHFVYILSISR